MQHRFGGYTTSDKEIKDLGLAWLAISLAFAIVLGGSSFDFTFVLIFIVSAITVGTGFILHELAHKIVAQKFGCYAEFRADYKMLGLAVLMSFFGFIFAAPGAVMISGYVNRITNGKISAAGPVTNLVVAFVFMVFGILFGTAGFLGLIFSYGFMINTWLGLFNMIPFSVFDGAKILKWNSGVYYSIVAVGVLFLMI